MWVEFYRISFKSSEALRNFGRWGDQEDDIALLKHKCHKQALHGATQIQSSHTQLGSLVGLCPKDYYPRSDPTWNSVECPNPKMPQSESCHLKRRPFGVSPHDLENVRE
ncbi:uncharacterized protein [Typha angustifolia]|uniref:uncharacterized protein isoform X1 n=1 Tax=Typha angustifolia TaxID=59011 RepID=UPI003C2F8ACB